MQIHKANKIHIDIIADFQVKMASETENLDLDIQTVTKGIKAVFEDANKGQYYIAEQDDKIIASMLTTYEWSDWRNASVIWLQSVYVCNEYRGRGVFKAMYAHIKENAEKGNYAGIRLYVDKTNISAQSVYNKTGMSGEHYILYEDMF